MPISIEQLSGKLDTGAISIPEIFALRRELGVAFRYHPLGFIACTLLTEGPVKLRLHYWPVVEGAQQSLDCQIHDHLFEFRSWVMMGVVENIEYGLSIDGSEYFVYRVTYSGEKSIIDRTSAVARVSESGRQSHRAGSSYFLRAGVMHETVRVGSEPAITVLRTRDVSDEAPVVLGPKTGSGSYSYTRSVVEEEIIDRLLSSIGVMQQHHRFTLTGDSLRQAQKLPKKEAKPD